MTVDKSTEEYLIKCRGLTKRRIKEMLPSEIDEHCKKITRQEIDARGIYKPKKKKN
jgi:hypothetical protein